MFPASLRLRRAALLALCGLCASFSFSALAQEALPRAVHLALARAGLPDSSLSVVVTALAGVRPPQANATTDAHANAALDAPLDTPRLRYRASRVMAPASTMKLLTTYAALESLGADFRWHTAVLYTGRIRQDTLEGDLIVQGGGDPFLVTERVQDLWQQVQQAGIHTIAGDLIADRSLFQTPPHDPGAFDEQPDRPYNAAPDALLFDFNALTLHITPQPDDNSANIDLQPPLWGSPVPRALPLRSGPCPDPKQALGIDLSDPNQVRFAPSYPRSCGERTLYYAYYAHPEEFAPRALAGLWQAGGGQLQGVARQGSTPPSARLLLRYDSLPLADIIHTTNKFSNNVMAQQIFLSLPLFASSQKKNRPTHGSFAASQRWMQNWWQQHLPASPAPQLENGSGLSRRERISAASLDQLLEVAARSPQFADFYDSLAIAGVDGTVAKMQNRLPDSPVLGHARLKTGTLDDAKAIAGYVTGQSGQLYSVVGIINHERAAAGQPALDALLDWVARDLPQQAAAAPSQ